MDQEHRDYADSEPSGHSDRQILASTGWRPAATAAIVCVVLIPLLAALCLAVANAHPASQWIVGLAFAAGIGFAIAGVRRGSRASRAASAICLVVLALPVVGATIIGVLLAVYGMPRLG